MRQPETVLVTGGGGFIGSHTCVALLERGHDVVVVDDHSTSSPQSIDRIRRLAGSVTSYSLDITNRAELASVLRTHSISAVIHFAARKAVAESTQIPLQYFDINVGGTASLLRAMRDHGVNRLVFSSSCSIYGAGGGGGPLKESAPPAPTNPYAWSKWTCEQMIGQAVQYHPELRAVSLRYFNPIGAHRSGILGEDPKGVPQNVMPYLAQIAIGRLEMLSVFGADYPTRDGSAVRDYIHVVDVADGHVVALDHIDESTEMVVLNLGTGVGTSVLELRSAFSSACGCDIPYVIKPRRSGDVPELVADAGRVHELWGWKPRFGLDDMCRDAWNFQRLNPNGYSG
jgi:UDP-glucose 4-epimerase